LLLLLVGVFMTKTGSSGKIQVEKVGPEIHPEQSLPPLCRLNDILRVVPIKRSTVWLWARKGKFPKPFKFGSLTLWRRDDVLAWLEKAGGAS
jgi:predicted DNA-binding transcriptional regulator AlpA